MARLSEISAMKTKIVTGILNNQNICKAVHHNEANFLDNADINDSYSLMYERVFPYRRIPEVDEESRTCISLAFNRFRKINNSFKEGLITIYIVTHIDLVKTNYGALRYDFIANEIDELFNQSRGFGIGQLEFSGMDDLYVNKKFIGMSISYRPVDFN